MYSALYPSIIDQSNMAPNTMYGKLIIDEQIDEHENKFSNEYFARQVWFMEDLISNDVLDFCNRYLHLPTYEDMARMVNVFFHEVTNPLRGLRIFDNITGNKFMYHLVDNTKKRQMYHLLDDKEKNQKRQMYRIIEAMPKEDDNKDE